MSDGLLPPIPADADLRDFPYTPIFRARLFGSSFHARATDAEWRAGVTLWLKSWDQVPAGSLPDDDIDLCRLAELGRDLKTWRKIRAGAMHGWHKCDDGRLYHAVVAESVLDAYDKRRKASSKGRAGALKRWSTGNASAMPEPSVIDGVGNGTGNATAIAQAMPGDSKRREGKGREGKEIDTHGLLAQPGGGEPDGFAAFRAAYPRRSGSHRWQDALNHYRARLREGTAPADILTGAQRYAAYVRARGIEGSEHVLQAATFLGKNRGFAEPWDLPKTASGWE